MFNITRDTHILTTYAGILLQCDAEDNVTDVSATGLAAESSRRVAAKRLAAAWYDASGLPGTIMSPLTSVVTPDHRVYRK